MKIFKEPLLHFLLIGAGLFWLFSRVNPDAGGGSDDRIVVSAGRIDQLTTIFVKTWQRPPTADELKALIDDYVLEELYYRKAVAMGIDRDDTVIRRRLRQKVEFLSDDAAALADPADEDLNAYLSAHEDKFRTEPVYTFRQVYFNPERHGDDPVAFVRAMAAELRAGAEVAGDSTLLPESMEAAPRRAVGNRFGLEFVEKLDTLTPGEWSGPISTGLGMHLVRLESRVPGRLPALDEIRRQVKREWANQRRLEVRRKFNEELLKDYEVVIEWPESESIPAGGAGIMTGIFRHMRGGVASRRSEATGGRSPRAASVTCRVPPPWAIGLIVGLALAAALPVRAHEMRPAYLQITETGGQTYDVVWKVPARGENEKLSLRVRFSDDTESIGEPVGGFVGSAHVQRWRVRRPGGLAGSTITIVGLESTFTDVLMRLERADGTTLTHRFTADKPSYIVGASPSLWQVAWTYLTLGTEHILLGIDHLLFVLALLLLVRGRRKLVMTITAFTLAHSITLALAALGFVHVPGPPVEAFIALSIVFVAAEIVHGRQGRPGLTARWPWIVAFTFGLLHGFGFAGARTEVGLPQKAIPLALLFFNVGVEIGQLIFVFTVLALWALVRRARGTPPSWAWRIPPYAIGGVAAYWMIDRVAGFWQ